MPATRKPLFTDDDIAWANATWGEGNWTTIWNEETQRWMMLHKNNPKAH